MDAAMNPSARTIVVLNIEHYRKLLATEHDPAKRTTISKLLAEEEEKLASLPKTAPSDQSGAR
jgi:hypothetical protein